jgi:hypothetical protein
MGLFFPDAKDHIKFNDVKKLFKSDKFSLSSQQQQDALKHFEGRDTFKVSHVKEIARKIRATSGDSLQSTHIDRIERELIGHIESKVEASRKPEAPKPAPAKPERKPFNIEDYRFKRPDKIDDSKNHFEQDTPASQDHLDRAA